MRDALAGLHDEVGKFINDNGMTYVRGSVAEAEYRVADRESLHSAYVQGYMLLEATADHTFALTRLLVEPVQTIAPWTCVRAALEASAIACWLLDHHIDSHERIGRSIALRCEGLEQQRKLARSLRDAETEESVDSRLCEVEELALALGYQERQGKGGRRIRVGPPMPSTTAVIAQTLDQEATFRILSAMAHGHTWALVRLGFEAPDRTDPTVIGKALSLDSAAVLLMTAADSLALPVWSEACLFGHDSSRLSRILERSYSDMGLNKTRHFWLDVGRCPPSALE